MWVRGHPVLDQVVLLLETIFVRGRAYPMFTLLFGYGNRLTFVSAKASSTPDPVAAAGIRVLEWVHGSAGTAANPATTAAPPGRGC